MEQTSITNQDMKYMYDNTISPTKVINNFPFFSNKCSKVMSSIIEYIKKSIKNRFSNILRLFFFIVSEK